MIKLPNENEIEDNEEKVNKTEINLNETSSKSPQKSLAITKGPAPIDQSGSGAETDWENGCRQHW